MGLNEAVWALLPGFFKVLVLLVLRIGAVVVLTLWLVLTLLKAGVL